MKKNLVSICIATFNRKLFLPKTLKSILNQNYKNIEIIIVDDCSNDGTRALIRDKFLSLDGRIKYIKHKKNKGLAASRNTAIKKAKGRYFTFCDDDDLWEPSFITEFLKVALKYKKNWCFCCSGIYKNILGSSLKPVYAFEGTLKNLIKQGYAPPVSSQFYNLSILKRINGYNENIKTGVDHDLWIRLAKIGTKIRYIPKALSKPNANLNNIRISTSYTKRINGLKNSFSIWGKDLIKMYGNKFYLDFCNAYLYRENLKFFIKYLKEYNILMLFKIISNISLKEFLNIIIDLFIKFFTILKRVIYNRKIKLIPALKLKK